jgi:hypothetical protein
MSTPDSFEDNELDQESQFSSAPHPGLSISELTMEQELAHHRAQDGLLEQAQKRVKALEDELAEIQRPLDAQMARLNANLTAANSRIEELERAAEGVAWQDQWIEEAQKTLRHLAAFLQVMGVPYAVSWRDWIDNAEKRLADRPPATFEQPTDPDILEAAGTWAASQIGEEHVIRICRQVMTYAASRIPPGNEKQIDYKARADGYADEINRLRNVIQSACLGGMASMATRWAELFPDAGRLPDYSTPPAGETAAPPHPAALLTVPPSGTGLTVGLTESAHRLPPGEYSLYVSEWAATCAGCGCTDDRACAGGCSWLAVDRVARAGVCSNCQTALKAWKNQRPAP